MSYFATPAIVLRAIGHGDYDLIVTFFTLQEGKITAVAKSAKRSRRRFGGSLDLFSSVRIVYNYGTKGKLPLLEEASVADTFERIRTDAVTVGHASYWVELVNLWMEDHQASEELFRLMQYALEALNGGAAPEPLSLFFQMRFMTLSGFSPNLTHCANCDASLEAMGRVEVPFDHDRGGILCPLCKSAKGRLTVLSLGTIRQLLWVCRQGLAEARRVRFSERALREGLTLMERFVPYHLGAEPKSLRFLKQVQSARSVRVA